MGFLRRLMVVAVFVVAAASTVAARAGAADESAIRSAYSTLQEALLQNDVAALSSLLSFDFSRREANGTVESRDTFVKIQTENTPGLSITSARIALTSLVAEGNNARADAAYTYVGTYAAKGSVQPFRAVSHVTDTWVKADGSWKMSSSVAHDLVTYVGGKIVQSQREQLPPSSQAIAQLQKRAFVIPSLALNAEPDQLAPIGAAIGNARIVGMGEGSHGTSQFFAFKNRLFKYLVENKGFTVFAIEGYWGAGLFVDRYIKGGRGTAAQAVASLQFWTWDTPEMVDLVQWMHDYNARPGKHPTLSFAGFDMQDPMGAIGYLASYLRQNERQAGQASTSALDCVAATVRPPSARPVAQCRNAALRLQKYLETSTDSSGARLTRQAIATILQYIDSKSSPNPLDARDRDMAANVEWLASSQYPRAKIALWAHNGHVGASSNELSYKTMGTYLRQRFGGGYYAIGQTFDSGTVRAVVRGKGLQSVSVPAVAGDTTAAIFAPLKAPAFVDLRGLRAATALQRYFAGYHDVEEIGAGLDPQNPTADLLPMILPNSFDGLVFMPVSTAATSAAASSTYRRKINAAAAVWQVWGIGFNDVTVTPTAGGAVLTNGDPLNQTLTGLSREFDARPYAGRTVRISGDVRRGDFIGFAYPAANVVAANPDARSAALGNTLTDAANNVWAPFRLTLAVPADAVHINVGFASEGFGSIELRNVSITPSS